MKTAISLPNELFDAVDRTAQRLGISRSELFARAAQAYLKQHSSDTVRSSYDAAYQDDETSVEHRARRRVAREVLSSVEW
ncbi:MAG: ribbon-helix-helix protein, CopG family [Myxococcota bacterium]